MNEFDRVIGYDTIKNELMQIVDMVHNKERYEALGARMPSGVLLYGEPRLGKTLLAKCFMQASGLTAYTLTNNKGGDAFVNEITATFEKAKANAPSVIFLDDMDKFANDDERHCDAKEYVAVQAGIDSVKGCDVFVIATTNALRKLPDSLIRSGRFDRTIVIKAPTQEDAAKIIKHYMKNKNISPNVDFDDLCKMMSYHSCADLETVLNEAAICAAYNRKNTIEMEELVDAVLRIQYNAPDDCLLKDKDEVKKIALHEAGHLVVSELVRPGSVGLASVRTKGRNSMGGFVHRCAELDGRSYVIVCSLAGKVATEMYNPESCASGCESDLNSAIQSIRDGLTELGTSGVSFLEYERFGYELSDRAYDNREAVVHAELERYLRKTRNLLIQNREFLEKITDALVQKETLLCSDIQKIRESVTVTEFVA